jgi:anaerobic selenocysteine-containing dehydrogenase
MKFPSPWAIAMGGALSDMRNVDTIPERQEHRERPECRLIGYQERSAHYVKCLEHRMKAYQEEHRLLLHYANTFKKLYYYAYSDLTQVYENYDHPFPPGGFITSIGARVTGVSFFEAGFEIPEKEKRIYNTKFPKLRSRSIYWELNLRHIPPEKRIDFKITAVWYPPDFTTNRDRNITHTESYILPEWEYSYHVDRYGFNEFGKMAVGAYQINLYTADEEFVGQAQFEIV